MPATLTLGARGSDLALIQMDTVRSMLEAVNPGISIEVKIITTEGDRNRVDPLSSFGGRGAFVSALETALVNHEIDAAVHSLKDLPSKLPEGLALAATPVREDPRDALVTRNGATLDKLPQGAVIGTGSDRRSRQVADMRPQITFSGIRGNVETRIRKVDEGGYDGVILAAAGLNRLDLDSRIAEYFNPDAVVPAPCQGIIGIECRADDRGTLGIFETIEDADVRICADTERAFIATLGLGCHEPIAAHADIDGDEMTFRSYVYFQESGRELRKTIHSTRGRAVADAIGLARSFKAETAGNGEVH